MAFDFDLFVIGAGSAGVRAARVAAEAGARVAVAEEYRYGGTCVIRGCVPKKLMVYASAFADAFEDARGFGWTLEGARFDWSRFRAASTTCFRSGASRLGPSEKRPIEGILHPGNADARGRCFPVPRPSQ